MSFLAAALGEGPPLRRYTGRQDIEESLIRGPQAGTIQAPL